MWFYFNSAFDQQVSEEQHTAPQLATSGVVYLQTCLRGLADTGPTLH